MAISDADLKFLRHLLNARLEKAHRWPQIRLIFMFLAILWIGTGVWQRYFMPKHVDTSASIPIPPATLASQPVTRAELDAFQKVVDAEIVAQSDATSSEISADLQIWTGLILMAYTCVRWGSDRRDIALITLLRDKCSELRESAAAIS